MDETCLPPGRVWDRPIKYLFVNPYNEIPLYAGKLFFPVVGI